MSKKQLDTFDTKFWISIGVFTFIIGAICFFPYWFTSFQLNDLDFRKTGEIGDTLGGIMSPFIAIAAAILTFIAFWVQYKANDQQKIDLQIERFENKFYAMIEIHRNNVNELIIGKTTNGRKAFISLFNELKFTHLLVEDFYENTYKSRMPDDVISKDVRYNIAYLIFFFGVGHNSSPIIIDLIGKKYEGFFLCVEESVKRHQAEWGNHRARNEPIAISTPESFFSLDIKYKPCNGHMSKLSHYLRHLFQLVKFIDDADKSIFTDDDKYNYATTVRSQLSVHEQLLLFYNGVSILGKPWLEAPELMKKYCMVKSSPITIADFYKKPIDVLGDKNANGKPMFEWGEIQERFTNL